MCDYSLHAVASRPAQAGDQLITTGFRGTSSRGFAAREDRSVAVCLRAGTEIAFQNEPIQAGAFAAVARYFGFGTVGAKLARFRKLHIEQYDDHHDALEFANGKIVYLTTLRPGQEAVILQLPVGEEMPSVEAPYVATSSDRADA